MAKAKKVITEPQVAQMAQTPDSLAEIVDIPKIFVPDIPAQEEVKKVVKEEEVIVSNKPITEIEFLKYILHKQHTGGFGRHLDELINERIKSIS